MTSKLERMQQLEAFLQAEGFRPSLDDDHDILFKYEGKTFFIIAEEEDASYYQVLLPNFWPIESDLEHRQAYIAAAHANQVSKVAKVYPVDDNVWASAELFSFETAGVQSILMRACTALLNGAHNFKEKMQALNLD